MVFPGDANRKSVHSINSSYYVSAGSDSQHHGQHGCCTSLISRLPYATLIGVVLSLTGVAVFCATLYRGVNLTLRLLQDVFQLDKGLAWIQPTQLGFIILGASMAALSFIVLVVSFLATGATRHEFYRSTLGRVGGRIACIFFMLLTYILLLSWLLVFVCCISMTVLYTLSWGICNTDEIRLEEGIIDFYPIHFMFPYGTQREHMEVRGQAEIKMFCKDYVEHAELMFIMASISCLVVIISLVHFLMALSANVAHIGDHYKFNQLNDLADIAASEHMTLTERSHYK